MGAPVPPPPPEHLGGPSGSWGNWGSEEAKRKYVRMLERHVAGAPPTWVLVVAIVAVLLLGAVVLPFYLEWLAMTWTVQP
ncbi:hypothetical protein LCGC14_0567910 [marine sediment metagenome]|uniref:Uncharacterized protein n=1 Tax=marine sediment metagenome TaxID=412755 RepID=A0A0F9U6G0_9ZZZZ